MNTPAFSVFLRDGDVESHGFYITQQKQQQQQKCKGATNSLVQRFDRVPPPRRHELHEGVSHVSLRHRRGKPQQVLRLY